MHGLLLMLDWIRKFGKGTLPLYIYSIQFFVFVAHVGLDTMHGLSLSHTTINKMDRACIDNDRLLDIAILFFSCS